MSCKTNFSQKTRSYSPRNVEKAENLRKKGVETVLGDFVDIDSLKSALNGVERVFLLSPASLNQVDQQGNVVNVAITRGIKHIVKLSTLGTSAHSPVKIAQFHAATEKQIRASGIAYTFLHPHTFMQNQLAAAPSVKAQGKIYAALGDAKVSMVDARDIANVAAHVLTEEKHYGKTYQLTGSEALSMYDVAETIGHALHKEVTYQPVSFEEVHQAMLNAKYPKWLADDMTELNKLFAKGEGCSISNDIEIVTQQKPKTFKKFIKDFIEIFR